MNTLQNYPVVLNSLFDTSQLACSLANLLHGGDVVLLHGNVGLGKTTFCQFLIQQLLAQEGVATDEIAICSPTFSLMNLYQHNARTICHFDLYRLRSPDDFVLRGFTEYLHKEDTICLVEWPEAVIDWVDPKKTWSCTLQMDGANNRIYTLKKFDED